LKVKNLVILLTVLFVFCPNLLVHAQSEQPDGPVYIVQTGDTLWGISRIFNVSLEDLADYNNVADPSLLNIGDTLVIPGMEGLEGVLVITEVPYGENMSSLSRRYQIPSSILSRLNRYTTSDAVAAGSPLVTLDRGNENPSLTGGRMTLRVGGSLLEQAILNNTTPWAITAENDLQGVRDVLPGVVLHFSNSDDTGPGALPEGINSFEMSPRTAVQGKTLVFSIQTSEDLNLGGSLLGKDLEFFSYNQRYVAIQGVHAMLEPGYYPSEVSGVLDDGTQFNFSQKIFIEDGGYAYDPPLIVNSETLEVENTKPEDLEWFATVETVSPDRMWDGFFIAPVPDYLKNCYPSTFGKRRSYNGSAYLYFHTGLDFCGSQGVEIYAPAPGRVVFTGVLVVRGNATIIDHGWGVYSAYAHQSEIQVEIGDWVETGQVIGLIGSTGRVTGPHLHWEVIVGGVQVDPLDWLYNEFP
jgi:murein DD-endopeptidase MepM/ murein hydrolase activator NlpD